VIWLEDVAAGQRCVSQAIRVDGAAIKAFVARLIPSLCAIRSASARFSGVRR